MSNAPPPPPRSPLLALRDALARRAAPFLRRCAGAHRWFWSRPPVQFLRPLGHLVAYYPLLIPIPVLLFAICWNRVLAEYDGFHIVWNPNWWEGLLGGFGVGVVLGSTVLAVLLLNQKRETPAAQLPEPGADPLAALAQRPGALPPTPQWAYWVLWAVLLVLITLPAWEPRWFVSENAPHPFRLNTFRPNPNALAAPTFSEAKSASADEGESRTAFEAAEARVLRSRWCFPLGVLIAGVAFGTSRLLWPEQWRDLDRNRRFAAWLVTLFSTYYALMFVAHGLLGREPPADEWWDHWATRIALWVLIVLGVARAARWAWPETWKFHSFGAGTAFGAFLLKWDGSAYSPVTAAPVALLALLGMLTGCAALVTSWNYPRRPWVVLAVLGPLTVPFLFSTWQTEYRVPGLEADYYGPRRVPLDGYGARRPRPGDPVPNGALVSDRDALVPAAQWLKGSNRPMVVVTVSGGASASAVYTAEMLFALEARHPGFVSQVRVITGASGGMLGAAYFVAAFQSGPLADARDRWLKGGLPDDEYRAVVRAARQAARDDLGRDFLGPLVQRWIYLDMPMYFVPRGVRTDGGAWRPDWGTTNDRGLALEQGWQRMKGPGGAAPDGVLHRPFAALREDERTARLPSLIFTPMMIEDGRQLLISNLDLDYMVDSRLPQDDAGDSSDAQRARGLALGEPSHTALEFYRLFPGSAGAFRLSTAVRLNASFPFFSPPAALPTDPPRHLVDAGYFDNYGTLTGTKWLYRNAAPLHAELGRGASARAELVLLQLRCYAFERETTDWLRAEERDANGNPKLGPPAALHSLAAPFAGALASRRANMVYRGDERLDGVNQLLDRAGLPQFERVLIECNLGPSLNWVLTPDTLRMLRHEVWEQVENEKGDRFKKGLDGLLREGVRP